MARETADTCVFIVGRLDFIQTQSRNMPSHGGASAHSCVRRKACGVARDTIRFAMPAHMVTVDVYKRKDRRRRFRSYPVYSRATLKSGRDTLIFLNDAADIMFSTVPPSLPLASALHLSSTALGNVIRKAGTPDFVQAASDLISESIESDSVYFDRSRPDGRHPHGYVTDWFGSAGNDYKLICAVAERYYEAYSTQDALRISCFGQLGTQVSLRDVAAIPPSRFRREMFDRPRTAHECTLVHGTRTAHYFLGLNRVEGQPAFTLAEMTTLRQMGEFLAPLFELHAGAGAARRTTATRVQGTAIEQFDRRVGAQAIRLSQREYQICRALLSGRTIPETAHALELRLSTAESYVQRAFAKLGIRTKWELLQWAHAPD